MSDFIISFIRTAVPMLVGTVSSYLITKGVEVTPELQIQLIGLLTSVISLAYYSLARLLETKYPKLGIMLGIPKTPIY